MENRVSGAFVYAVPVIVIVLAMMVLLPIAIMDYVSYKGWLNAGMVEVRD